MRTRQCTGFAPVRVRHCRQASMHQEGRRLQRLAPLQRTFGTARAPLRSTLHHGMNQIDAVRHCMAARLRRCSRTRRACYSRSRLPPDAGRERRHTLGSMSSPAATMLRTDDKTATSAPNRHPPSRSSLRQARDRRQQIRRQAAPEPHTVDGDLHRSAVPPAGIPEIGPAIASFGTDHRAFRRQKRVRP